MVLMGVIKRACGHRDPLPKTIDLDSMAAIAMLIRRDQRPNQSIRLTTTLVFFAMAIAWPVGEMA